MMYVLYSEHFCVVFHSVLQESNNKSYSFGDLEIFFEVPCLPKKKLETVFFSS